MRDRCSRAAAKLALITDALHSAARLGDIRVARFDGLVDRGVVIRGTEVGVIHEKRALIAERLVPDPISGTDRAAIETAVAKVSRRKGLEAREVAPTLEDVFIHLMRDLGEGARPQAAHG